VTAEPLEAVLLRLADHGIEPQQGIQDETFGRSIVLHDPDGTPVQVNEHH
jgi:catechol-2,3-dioxygenase